MNHCPHFKKCPFFNKTLRHLPAMTGQLIKDYCQKDYNHCARYLIMKKSGSTFVTDTVFPHHYHKVDELMKKSFKKG